MSHSKTIWISSPTLPFPNSFLPSLSRTFPFPSSHKQLSAHVFSSSNLTIDHPFSVPFACQVLPNSTLVSSLSFSLIADQIVSKLTQLHTSSPPPSRIRFLVGVDGTPFGSSSSPSSSSRHDFPSKLLSTVALTASKSAPQLRFRQRLIHAPYLHIWGVDTPFNETIIQIMIHQRTKAFLSIVPPHELSLYQYVLSPFAAGSPPSFLFKYMKSGSKFQFTSSAHLKLIEALIHMGKKIENNQLVVDLGSAPGSWTQVALIAGATVLSVDKASMKPFDPLRHIHLVADGATISPQQACQALSKPMLKSNPSVAEPETVDWLLSDMLCEPSMTMKVLENWVFSRRCGYFVINFKFLGDSNYSFMETVFSSLIHHQINHFRLRHLRHNKNEICLMGCTV